MTGLEPDGTPKEKAPFIRRLADVIRALYCEERTLWNAHYKRYFKIAARALALGFVLGFVYFSIRPAQEKTAFAFLMKSLRDIPLGASPTVLALTLFYHNAQASLLAVAAGGLPFLCLPVLDPLANGAALGLLASISKHQGLNVPLLFLKSVAPHGIVELPAVLYATSVGLYLSVSLAKRALAKYRQKTGNSTPATPTAPLGPDTGGSLESYPEKPEADSGNLAGKVIRSFVIVVLPLLLVAAFIEAFITPVLR
jgi:stage II sporulation protein M